MPQVRANDLNIYYEVHGRGEPLMLIPGLSTDITAYRRIIAALARDRMVIAADNRGAGRTEKPDVPYSIAMMAEDTAGLLTALGIRRADVLGVSMGGRIAVELALRHPERVRSLILVSTFVRRISPGPRGPLFALAVRFPLLRRIGKRYPQPQYAFERQLAASRDYDATDRLSEIAVPTLILHGRDDRVAPLAAAEEMHAGIPGSRMLTFPGGHIVSLIRGKEFDAAVLQFLRAQASGEEPAPG